MAKRCDVVGTGIPGIKRRISDDMYIVTLDYGRQYKTNKKTGKVELKQIKTTRVVKTLKEAKALQGENNKEKKYKKITGTTKKLAFSTVLQDYNNHYYKNWSDSYVMQKKSQGKRMLAYFGDRNVKEIETIDIEEFFEWCREPQVGFPHPLTNNSIEKIRTHLKHIWTFMKKRQSTYGIKDNVVEDTEVGVIERFEASTLSVEQLNYMLQDAVNNEDDYSILTMIGLASICSTRRGEICGLSWREVDFENKIIHIEWQKCQTGTGSIMKRPKTEKTRVSALPDVAAKILMNVKLQQEYYLERKVKPTDKVYMTKTNLINGYEPHPGKVSRRFSEFQNRMNKRREKAKLEPIPHIRLHDLRHTFVSLCLNSGVVNPFQVSANCGHTVDDNTTTSRYWHDQGDRKEIIDFMDSIIKIDMKIIEEKQVKYC